MQAKSNNTELAICKNTALAKSSNIRPVKSNDEELRKIDKTKPVNITIRSEENVIIQG